MRKFLINHNFIRCLKIFSKPCSVNMIHTGKRKKWVTSKDENREMMALWPDIVRNLTENVLHSDIPDVTEWSKKMLQYNVLNSKLTYSSDLIHVYKSLALSDQLTDENIRLARILGWCIEITFAFLLMEDDIMDHSTIRRGHPCWYLHNDIGIAAVNDVILLEQIIFQLLRINFSKMPYYLDLLNTFRENICKAVMGQELDLLSRTFGKKPDLNLFTMDRYNAIVKYKAAFITVELPLNLAMHLARIKDNEIFRQAKSVLLDMGNFIQVQDDYIDCFEEPEVIGEISTDIAEGKCSWPVVVALERVTPAQRKILEECYGENDPEKVARVIQLYQELELQTIFSVYKKESYNSIKTRIQQMSREIPHGLLYRILNRIYHRDGN